MEQIAEFVHSMAVDGEKLDMKVEEQWMSIDDGHMLLYQLKE